MTTKQTTEFPVGSWERPDAGGIVGRGEGVSEFFKDYVTKYGEGPRCFAGHGFGCERESVMEVYGLHFCEAHGEQAASAAIEELIFDVEQHLHVGTGAHKSNLSPHVEHALYQARLAPPDGGDYDERVLAAFPLDVKGREQVEPETFMYIEDRLAGKDTFHTSPPYDTHRYEETIVCQHMRLASEQDATWLVEMLEKEREASAAQAAWTLALYNEAGL